MDEKLAPELAVRLLRAKAAGLEHQVKADIGAGGMAVPHRSVEQQRINYLAADIALVAGLLADHIEYSDASRVLYEAHVENLIERVYALEGGDSSLDLDDANVRDMRDWGAGG